MVGIGDYGPLSEVWNPDKPEISETQRDQAIPWVSFGGWRTLFGPRLRQFYSI